MGLDDRDYMRERNRRSFDRMTADRPRPFAPPEQHTSIVQIIFFWLVLAFLLYKGYGWWQDKQQRDRAARQTAAAQAQMKSRQDQASEQAALQESLSRVTPALSAHPAAIPRPAPLPSDDASLNAAPSTGSTIYLCKSYSGSAFWAQAHCNQHNALIDSMASVPAGLPFDQQVQIAQQHRQALAQTVYAAPTPASTPDPAVANRARCQYLDARVEHLDSIARQPQSAQTQDRIRGERKAARDEQFSLRC